MSGQPSVVVDHSNRRERVTWRLDPSNYDFVNHLRDCLKYLCLALPEPTAKPAMLRAQEAIKGLDATSAMIRWNQIMAESEREEAPIAMGRRGAWNARRRR